jgi:dTDP-glucose 4,6-dehydratase
VRDPKRILVTGGCGFIGSATIRYLFRETEPETVVNLDALTYAADPANVAVIADDPRYALVHGDICDQQLVARLCDEHRIDAILHFAAESHVDRSIVGPGAFVQTNVVGTQLLLDVVRERPHIHFHHVSTDEVYGSLGPTGRFHETTPYAPRSPYAASKAASDHLVRAYAHTYGLSTTISNCSNNYGPYQFPEKLLPLMILNMLGNEPLPVYGDGSNVRDWLYVDDHAAALWLVVTRGPKGDTYNIGGDAERTNLALLHRLIALVAELADRDAAELTALIAFVQDRPGHDRRYAVDCSKLKRELGWTPQHDLDSGLRLTVRWYLEHADWVERAKSGEYRAWIQANYANRSEPGP